MQALTQEQAVRCQRACKMSDEFWNKLIYRVNLCDPFFWRPRLEDKLETLRPGLAVFSDEYSYGEVVWIVSPVPALQRKDKTAILAMDTVREIALYSAIEALEGKK